MTTSAGDPGRLHRLVVGVDGSEGSSAALRWAIDELDEGGELVVVTGLAAPESQGLPSDVAFWESRRRERESLLDGAWTECVRRVGRNLRTMVVDADPADAVLGTAEREGADAVVVGSHGHTRWAPAHLGGVTAKVLHRSDVPVVVVPAVVTGGSRLVVGVNGSAASIDALLWAMGHARRRGMELEAMWVLEHLYTAAVHAALAHVDRDEEAAAEALAFVVERAREETTFAGPVTQTVVTGEASTLLIDASADAAALVLGSLRLGPVAEFVSGSGFRRIAAGAACPVIAVPERP